MSFEHRGTERGAIEAYVRRRLVAECRTRGTKARIARITGFDPAHLSNVLLGYRRVGEDLARSLAEYWGISYAELEQLALGIPTDAASDPLPNLRLTLDWCREGYPAEFLRAYGRLARKATTDRPRRDWLDDIDAQLRRWARGDGICPSGIAARPVFPKQERAPGPPTSSSEAEAGPRPKSKATDGGRDGEHSRERLRVKRRLDRAG